MRRGGSPSQKSEVACSYLNETNFEPFFRHGQSVFLKRSDVTSNSFSYVSSSFFVSFALTDAAREAGAFSNPVAVFAWINYDLPHCSPRHGHFVTQHSFVNVAPFPSQRT